MKRPGLQRRWVAVSGLIALVACLPLPVTAQTPPSEEAIAQLVAEIAVQNRQIEANQKQIEERIAKIEEAVRQARLFAARGGRGKGANP